MFSDVVSVAQCLVLVADGCSFQSSQCGGFGTWKFGQTHSVEPQDFDFGLESAGDQGDDNFGELQRVWGLRDHLVFVINGGFKGKFICAIPLVN